jgi:hypothetical protein
MDKRYMLGVSKFITDAKADTWDGNLVFCLSHPKISDFGL